MKVIKQLTLSNFLLWIKFVIKFFFYYRVKKSKFVYLPNPILNQKKVSVVIASHGEIDFFKRSITRALNYCGVENFEFIVFDNNAKDLLDPVIHQINNPNLKVIHSDTNIGLNAYSIAFQQAEGDFFVCLDHDVVAFPKNWLRDLLLAYEKAPVIKFLATDVYQDQFTHGAKYPLWTYQKINKDHNSYLLGATGGWCTVTDRSIYEEVGGFPYFPDQSYFLHDKYYARKLLLKGYKIGITENVKVYHAKDVAKKIDKNQIDPEKFFNSVDQLQKQITLEKELC